MKTSARMLFGVLGLALLVPAFAVAAHTCDSDVSILSRAHAVAEEPAVNPHELIVCPSNSGADHAYDSRTIQPGANQIQVIYAPMPAPGPASPPLTATLSGLVSGSFQMTPNQVLTGIYRYTSAWIQLPGAARGSITAVVAGQSVTYHTVT